MTARPQAATATPQAATAEPRAATATPQAAAAEPAPAAVAEAAAAAATHEGTDAVDTEAAPPAAPAAAIDPRRLAAEVAVLDRARAALRAADVDGALAALDEHRRGFADGALLAEAAVVHIEAMLARGDRAAAAVRARDFLAAFPGSPLVKRVRSLLDRAVKETP